MNDWLAILPLLGVVIGAMLQYWFSRTAEASKQLELLRNQAYVDYLRAVAKAAHASSHDGVRSASADAADAKARIAIYGSQEVVGTLARFEEAGPVLDNAKSIDCFVSLASSMRHKNSQAQSDALRLVLVGKEQHLPSKVI